VEHAGLTHMGMISKCVHLSESVKETDYLEIQM